MIIHSDVNIHIVISIYPHFDLKIYSFNNRPSNFLLKFRRRVTLMETVITKIKFGDGMVGKADWHHSSDGNIETPSH